MVFQVFSQNNTPLKSRKIASSSMKNNNAQLTELQVQ